MAEGITPGRRGDVIAAESEAARIAQLWPYRGKLLKEVGKGRGEREMGRIREIRNISKMEDEAVDGVKKNVLH